MTDAADAWNEDHSNRPESSNLLRVVPRPAWHPLSRQPESLCGLVDQLSDSLVGRPGNDCVCFCEVECRAGSLADRRRLIANLLIEHRHFRGVQISKLEPENN